MTLLSRNAAPSLSFRSETPVQAMAPIPPFFFLQSETLQIFDRNSGALLGTLAPLAQLAELALPLATEFYAVVAGVDMAGTAGILDLVNADSAATQLAGDGAVVSALEVLRRATAVRCATMAQEPLRRRAFQEALKRLELKRAFGFADDAMTLLPLFPALLPNLAPLAQKQLKCILRTCFIIWSIGSWSIRPLPAPFSHAIETPFFRFSPFSGN